MFIEFRKHRLSRQQFLASMKSLLLCIEMLDSQMASIEAAWGSWRTDRCVCVCVAKEQWITMV